MLKDTKRTQTTVYKVQRTEVIEEKYNVPASVVRETITDE